jgi:hypothetical protein
MSEDPTRAMPAPGTPAKEVPAYGRVGPADPHADPATHPAMRPADLEGPATDPGIPAVQPETPTVPTAQPVSPELAVSPDGAFEVVKSTVDSFGHEQTVLSVRTRAGLLSRESPAPLAECGHDPFGSGMPPESVRFTSRTTVAIPVEGESTVVVTFDAETLRPDRTIQMCRAA